MLIKEKGIKRLNMSLNHAIQSTSQQLANAIMLFHNMLKQNKKRKVISNYQESIIYHKNSYKSKYLHVIKRNKLVNNNPWVSWFCKNK